jgi:hypothetical protein
VNFVGRIRCGRGWYILGLRLDGSITFVRLWCGELGREGGSWMTRGNGVDKPSDIVVGLQGAGF